MSTSTRNPAIRDAHQSPLNRAKRLIGGNVGLARVLGDITPQAISQWKQVPAVRVVAVARATGVPCHELRPDVFPAPLIGDLAR